MKKIIYTTDYSQSSIAALEYAVKLGQLLDMDVIALHVYPLSEEEGQDKKEVREKHRKKLLEFCKEQLQERYNASELSVAAIKGNNIAQATAQFIRDMQVHLVIMGACGTKTLKEMFLSSTTRDMINFCPFPVLAVPADYKPHKIQHILFASVLDDRDIEQLQDLVQIMAPAKPKIEILHITHKDEAAAQAALEGFKEKVEQKLSYENFLYRYIQSNQVFETLRAAIDEANPDLMMMPDRSEKSEMDKIIIRDKTKNLQSCTKVPLLSFPATV
ncbi:MAG: universal stress protein [Salinimicrobium sp.]